MAKKLNFKNKSGYKKWLAYGHIHHVFDEKTKPKITIHGHKHKVEHTEVKPLMMHSKSKKHKKLLGYY